MKNMRKMLCIVCVVGMLLSAQGAFAQNVSGTGRGFGGTIDVALTIENDKITACNIVGEDETPAIGGAAIEELAKQVVAANGADIDGVAGATMTSEGVRDAVTAALSGGNGEKKAMVPGTYTGTAMGINDRVDVEVTVSEDAIVSAVVTYNQETPGIGGPLYDKNGDICGNGGTVPTLLLPERIVAGQTLNVDAVAGATITSNAVIKAVQNALEQAGANTGEWQNAVEHEAVDVDDAADVVIVGAGGAGMSAAISAAQQGASVILVEKTGLVGGDTLVCGATYNTWDPEGQSKIKMSDSQKSVIESALKETPVNDEHAALIAEVKAEWDAFKAENKEGTFDSAAWFALQTWNGGDKVGDLAIIRKYADNALDGYKWLLPLGMEFNPNMGQGAGALWERSYYSVMNMGTGFASTYLNAIAGMDNIKVYVNMKGQELITDETGKVTGVICEDVNGEKHAIKANNGVVLATGGYGANGEMVQSHNTTGKWDDLSKVPTTNRYDCSQGDGIVMATAIGAATRDMDQIQLLYLGNLVDGGLTKYPSRCVKATSQTIFVNKEGNRFVQEDGRRDQICSAVLAQTDKVFYIIESADGSLYSDINDPAWRSADGFTREYLEENGYIYVADTLDELAAKLGVDAANLKNSVDTYNACYDAGEDKVFGRTNFDARLEHGPYVATPRQASIHHTMGGLKTDAQTHVLNTEGEIIDGLYAAGEVIGGLHGGNRLGGNAVTDVVVFGKLAGENAAANK